MSAFASALGQLGESYGKAGVLRQDSERADKEMVLRQLADKRAQDEANLQQQRFFLEKLAARRPLAMGQSYTEGGKKFQRFWDPDQAKMIDLPEGEVDDPLKEFVRQYKTIHGKDPSPEITDKLFFKDKPESDYEIKQDSKGRFVYMSKDPTKKPIQSDIIGKLAARGAGTGSGDARSIADKAKDIESGLATLKDFPTKERGAIATYMRENKMDAKRKLNAKETALADVVRQIEPKVGQLKKIIEDAGLETDNDWVFGNHSALMQHLRMFGYNRGVAPEKLSGDLIKTAAALQIMGAGPWSIIGRSKYTFETIKQHLPSPSDTPQQLYEKAIFLQGIVDEAKESLGQEAAPSFADPLGVLGK
jgi:hypothetical protein